MKKLASSSRCATDPISIAAADMPRSPIDQGRNTKQDLAHAFGKRERDAGVIAQAQKITKSDQSGLLNAQARRYDEYKMPDGLRQAFQCERRAEPDRVLQPTQRQPGLDGTGHEAGQLPADRGEQRGAASQQLMQSGVQGDGLVAQA